MKHVRAFEEHSSGDFCIVSAELPNTATKDKLDFSTWKKLGTRVKPSSNKETWTVRISEKMDISSALKKLAQLQSEIDKIQHEVDVLFAIVNVRWKKTWPDSKVVYADLPTVMQHFTAISSGSKFANDIEKLLDTSDISDRSSEEIETLHTFYPEEMRNQRGKHNGQKFKF